MQASMTSEGKTAVSAEGGEAGRQEQERRFRNRRWKSPKVQGQLGAVIALCIAVLVRQRIAHWPSPSRGRDA